MKLRPLNNAVYSSYESFSWIGDPACISPSDIEREFIAHRDELELLGGVVDETLSYEYDEIAVVMWKRRYYLLQTQGCSCPDPSETWGIVAGPKSRADLAAVVRAGEYQGFTLPEHLEVELLKVIEEG